MRSNDNYLSTKDLNELFISSLGDEVISHSVTACKPIYISFGVTNPWKLTVFLFNCSNPPGGRPSDEYKIVLNIGQSRGMRGNFDYSEGYFPIIVGYVKRYDIFVLWDATKHNNFAFNKNLQVKSGTILDALVYKISEQTRKTIQGTETILCATRKNLIHAIKKRYNASAKKDV